MARSKKNIDEKFYAPFPTRLRKIMEERGETQENIAEVVNKSRQTVSQYCNGISEPGYDTLVKISDHFNVSVDYLLGRTNDRSLTPSIYDTIGLSEESIRFLQLAKSARSDCDKLKELADILQKRNVIHPNWKYPELQDFEDSEIIIQRMAEQSAKAYAKSLPEFVDDLISIASRDKKLIRAYSKIVCPDTRPAGFKDVMPEHDYIRFQMFEISTTISNNLAEMLSDFEVSDNDNDLE